MAEEEKSVRLMVAEGTPLGATLLASGLRKYRDIRVVSNLSSSERVVPEFRAHRPDVLLLSAHFSSDPQKGIRIIRELRESHREVKVVVLLDSSGRVEVLEALRAGARGIFSRRGSLGLLHRCVIEVASGHVWLDTQQIEFVLDALAGMTSFNVVDDRGMSLLSEREQEVIACVSDGLTNRETAANLGLSEHTVKNHLFRIFEKLGVSNRIELVLCAANQQARTVQFGPDTHAQMAEELLSDEWCRRAADLGFGFAQSVLSAARAQDEAHNRITALTFLLSAEIVNAAVGKVTAQYKNRLLANMTEHDITSANNELACWLENHVELSKLVKKRGVSSEQLPEARKSCA